MADLRLIFVASILLLAGCSQSHSLTDQEKFDRSKQCVDMGMWPDVYSFEVRCVATGTKHS